MNDPRTDQLRGVPTSLPPEEQALVAPTGDKEAEGSEDEYRTAEALTIYAEMIVQDPDSLKAREFYQRHEHLPHFKQLADESRRLEIESRRKSGPPAPPLLGQPLAAADRNVLQGARVHRGSQGGQARSNSVLAFFGPMAGFALTLSFLVVASYSVYLAYSKSQEAALAEQKLAEVTRNKDAMETQLAQKNNELRKEKEKQREEKVLVVSRTTGSWTKPVQVPILGYTVAHANPKDLRATQKSAVNMLKTDIPLFRKYALKPPTVQTGTGAVRWLGRIGRGSGKEATEAWQALLKVSKESTLAEVRKEARDTLSLLDKVKAKKP
jgi:hypothetical protein